MASHTQSQQPIKESVTTVVTTLNSILREYNYDGKIEAKSEDVLSLINDDVKFMTLAMATFSLYIHIEFNQLILQYGLNSEKVEKYFDALNELKFRQMLSDMLRGRNSSFRNILNSLPEHKRPNFDPNNRNSIIQQAVKKFVTSFENSIKFNMRKRIVVYLSNVPHNDTILSKSDARKIANNLLRAPYPYDDRFGKSFGNLSLKPFSYLPMIFGIQNCLRDVNAKNFHIVPQNKVQPYFVHYTPTAMQEFRVSYEKKFVVQKSKGGKMSCKVADFKGNEQQMKLFEFFYDVEKFKKNGTKFKGFLTNGLQANLLYEKNVTLKGEGYFFRDTEQPRLIHKLPLYADKKLPVPNYEYIAGLDPGFRLMVGGVRYNVSNGSRYLWKLSNKEYHSQIGYKLMMGDHVNKSKQLESFIATKRQQLNNIGASSENFNDFAKFELKYLKDRVNLYFNNLEFRRMKFTYYVKKRAYLDQIVEEFCPKGGRTLLFYGGAKMNGIIKGYIRPPHQDLFKAFQRCQRCTVLITDEWCSTKVCCRCFKDLRAPTNSKDRYRTCDKHGTFNRDTNAGENIITKGLHEHFHHLGYEQPKELDRQRRYVEEPTLSDESEEEFLMSDSDEEI